MVLLLFSAETKWQPVVKASPQRPAAAVAESVRYRSVRILLLSLAICFALQVFSPLRLNNDSLVLLSMGDSAAHGGGFLNGGQKAVFPLGYPALLAVLLKVGFAHPWIIVSLNMVFLSVGLLAVYSVLSREFFEDTTLVLMICSFFLLSYVVIKHSTIPLTDVPFFCFSMSSIAVMSRAASIDSNLRFVILAATAWLLAITAITMRRVGVALVPPLFFMVVCNSQFRILLRRLSLPIKLIYGVAFAIVCVGTIYVVKMTSTLSDFIGATKQVKTSTLVSQILFYRLTELGELLGNLPVSKMPAKLHIVVPWIGLLLFLLVVFGLATKRGKISPTEVFLICYMGILFAWPYYDARFWLPVIPLLIAYSVLGAKMLRFPKSAVTIYCIIFATLGFGAIAYSTRISLAGPKFPDRYGDGTLRPTYCAAFQSCRDGVDPNKVDAKVLGLLREFK